MGQEMENLESGKQPVDIVNGHERPDIQSPTGHGFSDRLNVPNLLTIIGFKISK